MHLTCINPFKTQKAQQNKHELIIIIVLNL